MQKKKTDLKRLTGTNTSKKIDLASSKSKVDKINGEKNRLKMLVKRYQALVTLL